MSVCVCVCVCACVYVRACVRACVRARVPTWLCVCRSVAREDCTLGRLGFDPWTPFHDIWESEIRKEWSNSLHPPNTVLSPFFVGVPKVQEETSERSEKIPGRYINGILKVSRVT